MRIGSPLLVASAVLGATLCAVVACTFPQPILLDLPNAPEAADAIAPDARDASMLAPADAGSDGADAAIFDSSVTLDAPDGCDEDRDNFARPGGACGGLDCNDRNPNVFPTQDFRTFSPLPGDGAAGTLGDWNCDGVVERQRPMGVDPSCPNLLGLGCDREGFVGEPACGTMGRYVKCANVGTCQRVVDVVLPVGCR